MMGYIRNTHTYKSLREVSDRNRQLQIAEEAGCGLALFEALTEGVDTDRIHCPLPGYRDTPLYYHQLHSILAGHRTLLEANSFLPTDTVLREHGRQLFRSPPGGGISAPFTGSGLRSIHSPGIGSGALCPYAVSRIIHRSTKEDARSRRH